MPTLGAQALLGIKTCKFRELLHKNLWLWTFLEALFAGESLSPCYLDSIEGKHKDKTMMLQIFNVFHISLINNIDWELFYKVAVLKY